MDAYCGDYFGGILGLGRVPGSCESCGRGKRVIDESGYRNFRRAVVCRGRGEHVDGRDQRGVFVPLGTAGISGDLFRAGPRGGDREVEVSLKNTKYLDGTNNAKKPDKLQFW